MPKNKARALPAGGGAVTATPHEPTPIIAPNLSTSSSSAPPSIVPDPMNRKASKKSPNNASNSSNPPLVITRNKYLRYSSLLLGPWIHMPLDVLDNIATMNYNTPRPHPIDPAVLYDIVKIRRLVDDATSLAIRAASDLASSVLLPSLNGEVRSLTAGHHGKTVVKMSRERKFRMVQQACQKLSHAYRLDEIACAVATLQGASTLDIIGANVLRRNPDDVDAKYVQFFHEKITSRQVSENASLETLDSIIADCSYESEALRTRATAKAFKADYEGAIQDLTRALQLCRLHKGNHNKKTSTTLLPSESKSGEQQSVVLNESDQPSGLETQLLFMRAVHNLNLACLHLRPGLPTPHTPGPGKGTLAYEKEEPEKPMSATVGSSPLASIGDKAIDDDVSSIKTEWSESARKHVKTFAKRALRDFTSFLSHFDYTPHPSGNAMRDFTLKASHAIYGLRNPRHAETAKTVPHSIFAISDIFSATPPASLPVFPPDDFNKARLTTQTDEACTFHPLLTEALHNLLLCHCLGQTPLKALQRHAYNVARIARIVDAFPTFQASRSNARTDWVILLNRISNTFTLSAPWEHLCYPAPLAPWDGAIPLDSHGNPIPASGLPHHAPNAMPPIPKPQDRDLVQTWIDQISSRNSYMSTDHTCQNQTPIRWAVADNSDDIPSTTDRAHLISRWMEEVPHISLGPKKRKKATTTTKKGKDINCDVGSVDDQLADMKLHDAHDA